MTKDRQRIFSASSAHLPTICDHPPRLFTFLPSSPSARSLEINRVTGPQFGSTGTAPRGPNPTTGCSYPGRAVGEGGPHAGDLDLIAERRRTPADPQTPIER